MKRVLVIMSMSVVFMLLVSGFGLAIAPAPSWSNGNYWKYDISIRNVGMMTATGTVWYNVTGIATRTVNSTVYNVFVQSIEGQGSVQITNPYPMTGVFQMGGKHWVERDTYKTVDMNETMTIFVMGSPMMIRYDDMNFSGPENYFNFPIDTGNKWWSNTTRDYKSTMWNMITGISHDSSKGLSKNFYNCTQKGNFIVPAGMFEGYVVNQTSSPISNSTEYIYSETVGNVILQNRTTSWGITNAVTSLKLSEYSYNPIPEHLYTVIGIIGFCTAIATLAVMVNRTKK